MRKNRPRKTKTIKIFKNNFSKIFAMQNQNQQNFGGTYFVGLYYTLTLVLPSLNSLLAWTNTRQKVPTSLRCFTCILIVVYIPDVIISSINKPRFLGFFQKWSLRRARKAQKIFAAFRSTHGVLSIDISLEIWIMDISRLIYAISLELGL